MHTITLIVDGMRCRRCVRQATALLRDVPGITTVTADTRTSSITVTGDITTQAALDALASTTFTVRVHDPAPPPATPTARPDHHHHHEGGAR